MKKSLLVLAMAAAFGSMPAFAVNVQGDSSGPNVDPRQSDFALFTTGYSGLSLSGSDSIDLYYGPIKGSNDAIADTSAAATDSYGNHYLLGKHINWLAGILLGNTKIAQVWSTTASEGSANFSVNTVRQMIDPPLPIMPAFGGLVIGQVANSSGTPLAAGSGVYFGEWAPKAANANQENNARLNMTSADRTVWYVGDNATTETTMPTVINATYGVIGISQTGTDASGNTLAGGLPDNLNLYKGKLDVVYAGGMGTIGAGPTNNSISRVVNGSPETINFAGTTISSNGTFSNSAAVNTIDGRFYNGAEALAGKYTNGDYADAAFGGSKISGTITP